MERTRGRRAGRVEVGGRERGRRRREREGWRVRAARWDARGSPIRPKTSLARGIGDPPRWQLRVTRSWPARSTLTPDPHPGRGEIRGPRCSGLGGMRHTPLGSCGPYTSGAGAGGVSVVPNLAGDRVRVAQCDQACGGKASGALPRSATRNGVRTFAVPRNDTLNPEPPDAVQCRAEVRAGGRAAVKHRAGPFQVAQYEQLPGARWEVPPKLRYELLGSLRDEVAQRGPDSAKRPPSPRLVPVAAVCRIQLVICALRRTLEERWKFGGGRHAVNSTALRQAWHPA